MKELTLDVDILIRASGQSDPLDQYHASLELIESMLACKGKLVMDSEDKLRGFYSRKLAPLSLGLQWIQNMASRGKIEFVKLEKMNQGVRVELFEKCHFDPNDLIYVRVASASGDKLLVSHDDDFSPRVRKCLRRRLEVRVLSADEAAKKIA